MTAAAKLAGVARTHVYWARDHDPPFRAAWENALEQSCDGLEVFAYRMCSTGLEITETRRTVERKLGPDGRLIVTQEVEEEITRSVLSPQMVMFLLRAYRPETYAVSPRRVAHDTSGAPATRPPIYRQPDPERALELARIALGVDPRRSVPVSGGGSGQPDTPR